MFFYRHNLIRCYKLVCCSLPLFLLYWILDPAPSYSSSTACVYVVAEGGLTNKLNIIANGRYAARHAINICGYLWEDGRNQLGDGQRRYYTVPPFTNITYLLDLPTGCSNISHPNIYHLTRNFDRNVFKVDKCLVVYKMLLAYYTMPEDNVFKTNVILPRHAIETG